MSETTELDGENEYRRVYFPNDSTSSSTIILSSPSFPYPYATSPNADDGDENISFLSPTPNRTRFSRTRQTHTYVRTNTTRYRFCGRKIMRMIATMTFTIPKVSSLDVRPVRLQLYFLAFFLNRRRSGNGHLVLLKDGFERLNQMSTLRCRDEESAVVLHCSDEMSELNESIRLCALRRRISRVATTNVCIDQEREIEGKDREVEKTFLETKKERGTSSNRYVSFATISHEKLRKKRTYC